MNILETTSGVTSEAYTCTVEDRITDISFSNDSASDISLSIKGMVITVKAGEVFEGAFDKPFIDAVGVTATGAWRMYLGD